MTTSKTEIKPSAALFQDAYHYALAAAGNPDSAFAGDGNPLTGHAYLARSVERMQEMGFAVRKPKTLREAQAFADNIEGLARVYGISAYRGESVCRVCGQDHPTEDHDYYARQALAKLTKGGAR